MTTAKELYAEAAAASRQEAEQAHAKLLAEFPALVQIESDLKSATKLLYEELKAKRGHPCGVDEETKRRVGQLFLDAQATGAFPAKKAFAEFARPFIPKALLDICLQLVVVPPPPPPKSNTPLDSLLGEIQALLRREHEIGSAEREALWDRQEREFEELEKSFEPQRLPLRVERGRLLIEARKLVPARSWEKWCRAHFPHAMCDIYACIALAEAEDPIAAHETEKAKAAERQRKSRASRKNSVTRAAVTEEEPAAPVTLPEEIVRDAPLRAAPLASAPDPRLTAAAPAIPPTPVTDESSEPARPQPSFAEQLAACPQWQIAMRNPIRPEELSQEYHTAVAALSAVNVSLERRLIELWINRNWNGLRQADTSTSDDAGVVVNDPEPELDPGIQDWIDTFFAWRQKKKKLAYSIFLQRTGVDGLQARKKTPVVQADAHSQVTADEGDDPAAAA